jgi:Eukaryotic-type carbonic anhydrase
LACTLYFQLGESDRAIDLLETYLQQVGPDAKLWFKNESDLDPSVVVSAIGSCWNSPDSDRRRACGAQCR